jgi:death on curing protein
MRYLSLAEVLELHRQIVQRTGGSSGVRELGGIQSALAQPQMTFGGKDLYPTLESKSAALCFSLVLNYPFIDGNKRIGHAAMETFLVLNGFELVANVDGAEQIMLRLAAGQLTREELQNWISSNMQPMS